VNDIDLVKLFQVQDVCRLEAELLIKPPAHIVTEHKFYVGLYERTITIPPWTVLTGATHKTEYVVRLERGTIAVNVDEGVKVLTGPVEFNAKAGIKRAGFVFDEEVVWTDVYDNPDNETDLAIIEARLYEIPECDLGANRIQKKVDADIADYQKFLEQIGLTQKQLDEIVHTPDVIDMPDEFGVELGKSYIHGTGLFAKRDFSAEQFICPGRASGYRTIAGRFINHSITPNAEARMIGDDMVVVATKSIQANEEILVDYRAVVKVNFGLELGEPI
jgi:hypothetical protein